MVRKVRVCFDEELAWNAAETEEAGGVAVQTQTAVLLKLHAEEEPADASASELEEEKATTPPQSEAAESVGERRHLAGANWLDDWTLYFPSQKRPGRTKRRAE